MPITSKSKCERAGAGHRRDTDFSPCSRTAAQTSVCAAAPQSLKLRFRFSPGASRVTALGRGVLAGALLLFASANFVLADKLHLADGTSIEVDEAWEDTQGVWYKRGGVAHLVDPARVRRIERSSSAAAGEAVSPDTTGGQKKTDAVTVAPVAQPIRIYLVGGAYLEVDEAAETAEGVWHRRGNISMLIDRARVERIERERPAESAGAAASGTDGRARGWSTGRPEIDALIRENGALFGVDPYLIFCVMEQESHFNARAVSPKGARGLMQLMPGTARRFGVRNVHDPVQNIRGGTRYLKELNLMFKGRVDLVLASYNAGEGAVMRYGHQVPPYRETRNYVKRIGERYQRNTLAVPASGNFAGAQTP